MCACVKQYWVCLYVRYDALMSCLLTLVTQSRAKRKVRKAVANVKSFLFLLRILKSSVRPVITASMPPICWKERLDQTQIVPMCLEDMMITRPDYMSMFKVFHYKEFLSKVIPPEILKNVNSTSFYSFTTLLCWPISSLTYGLSWTSSLCPKLETSQGQTTTKAGPWHVSLQKSTTAWY